ncbi:hypothetical protein HAP94_18235 [Acidithiobacillus ferrivorans]|nr:hypothetical protein [Acidithiobacillus ferrivorans]
MSTEVETTPSPKPTFWRQLLAHPKLHLAEYALSSLFFSAVGYLLTDFSYGGWVIAFSAVLGLFPTLSFVLEELDFSTRINYFLNNPSAPSADRWKLTVDGKSYGSYTSLEKNEARLSVIVDPFYVFSRLFGTVKWLTTLGARIMILSLIAAAVMANMDWIHHQAAFHTALIAYMAGKPHALMVMIHEWEAPSFPIALALYFYAWIKSNGTFSDVDTFDKKVAEILLDERKSKSRHMVYAEQFQLKVKFKPESLAPWELQRLPRDQVLEIEHLVAENVSNQKHAAENEN